jgi:hypothetical protein
MTTIVAELKTFNIRSTKGIGSRYASFAWLSSAVLGDVICSEYIWSNENVYKHFPHRFMKTVI